MVKVKAKLKLYNKDIGRTTPFISGYRPLFNFIPEMKTSGQILLEDRNDFLPGEEAIVFINFISCKFLGKDFGIGSKFTFGEGLKTLGEGEILEVIFVGHEYD